MSAKTQNITIDQGADYYEPFYVTTAGGAPENIYGASAAMQIRPAVGDEDVIITLTTEDGTLVIDGPAGTITPMIDDETTTAMTPGLYVYDIKMLDAAGHTRRTHQGNVLISGEVTIVELIPAESFGQYDFSTADNSAYAAII